MKKLQKITSAECEVLPPGKSQIDVINDAKTEILRLQGELFDAARTSLPKAIRIGELLVQIRQALPHGQWKRHLEENFEFSDQTARNWMRLWERRDDSKIKNILNLTDAYRLLAPSSGTTSERADLKTVRAKIPLATLRKWWLKASASQQKEFLQWAISTQKFQITNP
jgi:hypothetical protein